MYIVRITNLPPFYDVDTFAYETKEKAFESVEGIKESKEDITIFIANGEKLENEKEYDFESYEYDTETAETEDNKIYVYNADSFLTSDFCVSYDKELKKWYDNNEKHYI